MCSAVKYSLFRFHFNLSTELQLHTAKILALSVIFDEATDTDSEDNAELRPRAGPSKLANIRSWVHVRSNISSHDRNGCDEISWQVSPWDIKTEAELLRYCEEQEVEVTNARSSPRLSYIPVSKRIIR